MADTVTEADRSRVMSRIRARNTGLERRVRAALTRLGLRYRLHVKALPGTPNIVMRKRADRFALTFAHALLNLNGIAVEPLAGIGCSNCSASRSKKP